MPRLRHPCPVLIVIVLVAALWPSIPAKGAPPETANVSTYNLFRSIERLYGKQVTVEQVKGQHPDYCGESVVMRDGTPVVRISATVPNKDEVLAHELLHLKLRAEGFPRYYLRPGADFPFTDATLKAVWRMTNDIRDVIEHFVYLIPEMVKMDLDPYGQMARIYSRTIDTGYISTFDNPVNQALNYMKIVLETNDPGLTTRLDNCYLANRWEASLRQGKELVRIVKSMNACTPEEQVRTTLLCLNAVFKDRMSFEVKNWMDLKNGDRWDRAVIIRVDAAQNRR